MVDEGLINEAENMIYDGIDYSRKEEIATALLFYQYIGEKDNDFWRSVIIPKKKHWME